MAFFPSRGIFKQRLENKARYAVPAAKGTVAASASLVSDGTTKQIAASATVYWLYAPCPGISPDHENEELVFKV